MACCAAVLLTLLTAAPPSVARDYVFKGLKIAQPWARPAARGLNGALYFDVTNTGRAPDLLKAVETNAAKRAVIHRSQVVNGVSQMRPLDQGLPIPAGATVKLAPGGDHVMLVGLNRALTSGEPVPVTLVFQRAGRLQVELTVQNSGAAASPDAHKHHP